jgi:hypothetical protein
MYHFRIDPMPQDRNKALGDPSLRYMVLMVYVPASIIDWSRAKVVGRNLTAEKAQELEERLEKQYNKQ